jgi:HD-GYP domain-containing protein (c-di-GMP phosphodiesterase class II)
MSWQSVERVIGIERVRRLVRRGTPETLRRYLTLLSEHDESLVGHARNVSVYAQWLAHRAGLTPAHIEEVRLGGFLHDLGKLFTPASILAKDGALTREEWRVLQLHPEAGWRVLARLKWCRHAALAVRWHHERWDGDGYPDRLSGASIPIEARIVALADTLDAMTTDRAYRRALTFSQAREEIASLVNRQFDPAVVDAMLSMSQEDWAVLRQAISIQALGDAMSTPGPLRIRPALPRVERVAYAVAG